MATIGMDKLYYAKITEDANGEETYGVPISLAKAIKADLSIELAEATLYADDATAYVIKDFKSGTLSLGIDDIGTTAAQDLTGAIVDDNGVLRSQTGQQIPLLLAVSDKIWYPGDQSADQRRFHHFPNTHH